MSLVLNTNIDSIIAQNNLGTSQSLLSQSLTRLSSGLRINSAADDAAGLAISPAVHHPGERHQPGEISNANDAVSEAHQTSAARLSTISVATCRASATLAVQSRRNGVEQTPAVRISAQRLDQPWCGSSRSPKSPRSPRRPPSTGLSVLNGTSGTTTYQVGAERRRHDLAINLAQGVAAKANQIGQYWRPPPAPSGLAAMRLHRHLDRDHQRQGTGTVKS